jgi:DNA-binding winged helix-turn-helix (wHTH) protein/Tol biopolymer transport system component
MNSGAVQALEFGPFHMNLMRRLLYRDGTVVEIPPKAFAVLLVLVEHRGQVVGKQELMDAVWPNTAVEENNLARCISTLRRALGERSGEHRYILTVPGSGYSFVGEEASGDTVNASRAGRRRNYHIRMGRVLQGSVAVALLCSAILLWVSGRPRSVDRINPVRFNQIFTSQEYPSAGLAADGRHVVYAAGEPGHESVRLRSIESGKEVELLPASEVSYRGFTFTRDGRHLFLLAHSAPGTRNVLLMLPLSGGSAKEITRELDSPPTVYPDGSRIAFVRETQGSESVLLQRSLTDGKEDRLATAKFPTFLDYPIWSPDGQSIAYTEVTADGVFVEEIAVETGRRRRIGQRWQYVRRFAWAPRGDGFLVSAIERGADRYAIWHVARADGSVKRITENVDSFHSIVASTDGTRALTVAERSLAAVWVGTPGGPKDWRELLPASENVSSASWTTGGKILLARRTADGQSIHVLSPDGKKEEELLAAGPYHEARLCLGGQKLVYYSNRPDRTGLWLTDLRSGRSSQLVSLSAETLPECQQSSVWFVSRDPRWWPGLWKVAAGGGEPKRFGQRSAFGYAISADGRYVAYFDREGVASPQRKATQIVVDSLDGSEPAKRFDVAATVAKKVPLRWIPGEAAISYADASGGSAEIWAQPLSGGAPRQITTLSGGLITSFDWSPDGKQLVLSRGMRSFELLLLELSR